MKMLHKLTAVTLFLSLASMSTVSAAANNSASWAALSAATVSGEKASTCSAHRDGYPDPCTPFSAWLPLGLIVAAGVLAIILASSKSRGRGRGFSPG
jgi:hypothetical protein